MARCALFAGTVMLFLSGCPPTPPPLGDSTGVCESTARKLFGDRPVFQFCATNAPPDGTDPGASVEQFSIVATDPLNPCSCSDPNLAGLNTEPRLYDREEQKRRLISAGQLRAMCHTGGGRCKDPLNGDCEQWFVDPKECSKIAYLNGYALESVAGVGAGWGDGDTALNLCPLSTGIQRVGPSGDLESVPQEIRSDSDTLSVHAEVQWCRWFGGPFSVKAQDAFPEFSDTEFRPRKGERVSLAGDWVTDHSSGSFSEIHETRLMSTLRRDPSKADLWHLLTNGFFVASLPGNETHPHQKELLLDVPVPKPAGDNWSLQCLPAQMASGGCDGQARGVRTTVDVSNGACQIRMRPVTGALPPVSSWACGEGADPSGIGVPCPCVTLPTLAPEDQVATCRDQSFDWYSRCDPHLDTHIGFAGDIRAFWKDPVDFWDCQCACDDPAAPGATFAPVMQGCAPTLEEEKPKDIARACAQACAGEGTMCGTASSCRIGTCRPASGRATGRFIAAGGCEPPGPSLRVTEAAHYKVVIDPATSFARVGSLQPGGAFTEYARTPVEGSVWLNLSNDASSTRVEVVNVRLSAGRFVVPIPPVGPLLQIDFPRLFLVSRFDVPIGAAGAFTAPMGAARFGARANIDGIPGGSEFVTEGDLQGAFLGDQLVLDVAGRDPEGRGVILHVQGRVANHPPVANAGPDFAVECNSPQGSVVTLDAGASSDPDDDPIRHYQWFEGPEGRSIDRATQVLASKGTHVYNLHVYDSELSSGKDELIVNVVDTTPPDLTIAEPTCLWPPNHAFARFSLAEIALNVADRCDPTPHLRIVSVTANEGPAAPGSGNTLPDVVFGPTTACVRSERSGTGAGREYTVVVEARDASGNAVMRGFIIRLAHDRSAQVTCRRADGLDAPDETCRQ